MKDPLEALERRLEATRRSLAALKHPIARAKLAGGLVHAQVSDAERMLESAAGNVRALRRFRRAEGGGI